MLAPPLLVSFSSVDDYLTALPQELANQYEAEIRSLVNRGLPPVVSSRCLAVLFGFSVKFVNAMSSQNYNYKYYREFTIRKGTKRRRIQAPKVSLKVIQKWFGHHLSQALPVEDYIFGFVPGRSAVDAAQQHCNSRWVYSVDIKDFFPSTAGEVVKCSLLDLGYSQKACNLIVPLCCYKGFLAQGAPSSPVLSNLVMKSIDQRLFDISQEHEVTFTRYADDIVFSGSNEFPKIIKKSVQEMFEDTCWDLAPNKDYFADSAIGQRLKVHGLLVHGDKARLTKGYRNKIRAYKHLLDTQKVKEEDIKRLTGHVKYSDSVDSNLES